MSHLGTSIYAADNSAGAGELCRGDLNRSVQRSLTEPFVPTLVTADIDRWSDVSELLAKRWKYHHSLDTNRQPISQSPSVASDTAPSLHSTPAQTMSKGRPVPQSTVPQTLMDLKKSVRWFICSLAQDDALTVRYRFAERTNLATSVDT